MNFMIFVVFCLLLIVAALSVLLARMRSYSNRELLERVKPCSEHARRVFYEDTVGDVPMTQLQFVDMYRTANNLTIYTFLADRFYRVIRSCTNPDYSSNMRLTHHTYQRKRLAAYRSLFIAIVTFPFGNITKDRSEKRMGAVARHYTDVTLQVQEMVEIMDSSCALLLEGQFLHGS